MIWSDKKFRGKVKGYSLKCAGMHPWSVPTALWIWDSSMLGTVRRQRWELAMYFRLVNWKTRSIHVDRLSEQSHNTKFTVRRWTVLHGDHIQTITRNHTQSIPPGNLPLEYRLCQKFAASSGLRNKTRALFLKRFSLLPLGMHHFTLSWCLPLALEFSDNLAFWGNQERPSSPEHNDNGRLKSPSLSNIVRARPRTMW